jgi:hypothetical protein
MSSPRLTGRALLENEGLFTLKKKAGNGYCLVAGCKKAGQPMKVGLCHKHHQARWRHFNERPAAYNTLRDHAKARKIKFDISIDYFLGLADAYAFFDHEAESRGETLSIDRISTDRGYEVRNLRIITQSQNASRENKERWLPESVRNYLAKKRAKAKEAMADVDRSSAVESYEDRLERTGNPF